MSFKAQIKRIETLIKRGEKELEKLFKKETRAISLWRKGYGAFIKASETMATLKRHKTLKENELKKKILSWQETSIELTSERDVARKELKKKEEELGKLRLELATLIEQDLAEMRVTDEIVEQVFMLNGKVVEALEARNIYLSGHVYNQLIRADGKLRSQITFDDSSGTKRVVAMVNTISKVDPILADAAKLEIQKFFDRIEPKSESIDETTQSIKELLEEILIEKTSFKIGAHLYRFLGLNLNEEIFPELKRAQNLLKKSLRSEKTSSYIRLYTRKDRASKFEPVKQQG